MLRPTFSPSKYPPAEPGAYMRLRKSRVFLRDFPSDNCPFPRASYVRLNNEGVCLHSWHECPLCLAAPSGQPPKPAGSRRRREGLTAKARAEQKSSCNGCLAVLCPRQVEDTSRARARDILVVCHHPFFNLGSPSDRCDVGVTFYTLNPRWSPLLKLCDTVGSRIGAPV